MIVQGPLSVAESLASTSQLASIVQHLRHTLGGGTGDHDNNDDDHEESVDGDGDTTDATCFPTSTSASTVTSQLGASSMMGRVDATVWARVTNTKNKTMNRGYLPHTRNNDPHNDTFVDSTNDNNDNDIINGNDNDINRCHHHDGPPDQDSPPDDSDDLPLPSPITVPHLVSKSPVTVPQFTSKRPSPASLSLNGPASPSLMQDDTNAMTTSTATALATAKSGRGDKGLRVDTSSPRANSPGASNSPVSFALTITPRPLASAFSPVLPTQGQGLGMKQGGALATTVPASSSSSFGFETIDSHHHHHHHHHHDQHDNHHRTASDGDISAIININDDNNVMSSSAVSVSASATAHYQFLSSLVGNRNDNSCNDNGEGHDSVSVSVSGFSAATTPYASTDQGGGGPMNRAYCDIEVGLGSHSRKY